MILQFIALGVIIWFLVEWIRNYVKIRRKWKELEKLQDERKLW